MKKSEENVVNALKTKDELMDGNRKFIVAGTLLMIVFFGLLTIFNPEAAPEQPGYWLSFAIGAILGVVVCWYLKATWDPKTLTLKDPNAYTADPKWMGPTVILGIITAKLLPYIFAPHIQVMLSNLIIALFITSFGYVAFQVWRYRPK